MPMAPGQHFGVRRQREGLGVGMQGHQLLCPSQAGTRHQCRCCELSPRGRKMTVKCARSTCDQCGLCLKAALWLTLTLASPLSCRPGRPQALASIGSLAQDHMGLQDVPLVGVGCSRASTNRGDCVLGSLGRPCPVPCRPALLPCCPALPPGATGPQPHLCGGSDLHSKSPAAAGLASNLSGNSQMSHLRPTLDAEWGPGPAGPARVDVCGLFVFRSAPSPLLA